MKKLLVIMLFLFFCGVSLADIHDSKILYYSNKIDELSNRMLREFNMVAEKGADNAVVNIVGVIPNLKKLMKERDNLKDEALKYYQGNLPSDLAIKFDDFEQRSDKAVNKIPVNQVRIGLEQKFGRGSEESIRLPQELKELQEMTDKRRKVQQQAQFKARIDDMLEQSKRYVGNEMAKYEKIRLGMSREQVFNICGEPYRTSKTTTYSYTIEMWTYSIVTPKPYVFLTFQNDKLVRITQP